MSAASAVVCCDVELPPTAAFGAGQRPPQSDACPHGWSVRGLVVFAGYCDGTDVTDPAGPVIEARLLELAIEGGNKVGDVLAWLDGESWRPKKDVHFEVIKTSHVLGGGTFEWHGVALRDIDGLLEELFSRLVATRARKTA